MNGIFRLLILACAFVALPRAYAGPDLEKCKNSGKQHTAACMAHKNAAEGANTAQANAVRGGTNIARNSADSRQVNSDSANRLNDAKNKCEQEKQQCEKDCDQAKQSAQQKVNAGMAKNPPCKQSPCPEAKADLPQIDPAKESECVAPIMAMMGQLGQGANEAQNAANGDNNTNQASMPQIPPIKPPEDKPTPTPDPTGTSSQTPTNPTLTPTPTNPDKYACTTDANAVGESKCTNDLVTKCTPSLAENVEAENICQTFTRHYCNSGSGTPFPTATNPNSGQRRPGVGVGTYYCNNAIAKNFCKDPGRRQCATCQNYRSQFSEDCKKNPTTCNSGTQFSGQCPDTEPPIVNTPPAGTTPVTGGGGGIPVTGGGGGVGGGEHYSGASNVAQPANREASGAGPGFDMATGEGGGGEGSSGHDPYADKYRDKENKPSAGNARATSTGGRSPAGVGGTNGPSLFGITTAQIQRMCGRNQLYCAGRPSRR